jgi:hypothetical protein
VKSSRMPSQSYFAASGRLSLEETRFTLHRRCLNRSVIRPSVFVKVTQSHLSQMNRVRAI